MMLASKKCMHIKSALVLWLFGQINYCILLETCVYSITYNYSLALRWPPAAAVIEWPRSAPSISGPLVVPPKLLLCRS